MINRNIPVSVFRIFICSVLCLALVVPVWAKDISLTLDPTRVYAGNSVTISGKNDTLKWITIKTLDSDGNIVYLNSIMVDDNGNYFDTFKAPNNLNGELQVVVGAGSNTAKSILSIIESKKSTSSKSKKSFNQIKDEKIIEVKTTIGLVKLWEEILGNKKSENLENIQVIFKNVKKKDINAYDKINQKVKEKIGDRPIIEISFKENGKVKLWEDKDIYIKISIPYRLQSGENPEHIVVWDIGREENPISIINGRYNTGTSSVDFDITYFSTYAVAYVEKTFKDLEDYMWAIHPIEVLASKGIINGTGKDNYSPSKKITRADFLTLLIKTLELKEDYTENFGDVHPTDYYYDAVGIAKELDIVKGVDNNKFKPREYIRRQDMMVMVDKALRIKGIVTGVTKAFVIDNYSDKSEISLYAMDSVKSLIRHGIIQGSDNKIKPLSDVTRAEAAAVMYRIYNME